MQENASMWQPTGWADVLQPVAEFLSVTHGLFRDDESARAQQRVALLRSLLRAADAFEPSLVKTRSYKKLQGTVRDLLRYWQVLFNKFLLFF